MAKKGALSLFIVPLLGQDVALKASKPAQQYRARSISALLEAVAAQNTADATFGATLPAAEPSAPSLIKLTWPTDGFINQAVQFKEGVRTLETPQNSESILHIVVPEKAPGRTWNGKCRW